MEDESDESSLSYRVDDISHGSAISAARLPPAEFRKVFAERDREGDESLAGLKLAKLDTEAPRVRCPRCNAMRSSYCYACLDLLPGQSRPPLARLPFRFLIVTHQKEPRSRSTGVHAAVLAPEDIALQTYRKGDNSCLPPSLFPDGRTVLLFPCGDAMTVSQLADKQAEFQATGTSYSRDPGVSESDMQQQQVDDDRAVVVVVDSTWSQARQIMGHPCIASLPRVAVGSYRTAFWRRQHLGENYLSTVEAVYYTCREFDGPAYDGRYDNLLLFFVKCRNIVRERSGTVPVPLGG